MYVCMPKVFSFLSSTEKIFYSEGGQGDGDDFFISEREMLFF